MSTAADPHLLETVGPVVPVVVLDDAESAVPLARALADGGIPVMEVTLRTSAAVEVIRRVAAEVPEVLIGAGSVTSAEQVDAVCRAGASFLVLPGSPRGLLDAAVASGLPVLPGASTVTEVMELADRNIRVVKFFPAEASGGVRFLSSIAGPLPDVQFCPTGGVSAANAPDYLAQPNVPCVGGSWVTPRDAIRGGRWEDITSLARAASALGRTT